MSPKATKVSSEKTCIEALYSSQSTLYGKQSDAILTLVTTLCALGAQTARLGPLLFRNPLLSAYKSARRILRSAYLHGCHVFIIADLQVEVWGRKKDCGVIGVE